MEREKQMRLFSSPRALSHKMQISLTAGEERVCGVCARVVGGGGGRVKVTELFLHSGIS